MNISSINSLINNKYLCNRKTSVVKCNSLPDSDVFINNSKAQTKPAISQKNPSFKNISEQQLYRRGASIIASFLLNNNTVGNQKLPANSGRVYAGLIRETVNELRNRCTNLDDYRNNLVKLLNVLNNTETNGNDIYEPIQFVTEAINNSYNEYGDRVNPATPQADSSAINQSSNLTAEQKKEIRDIVSEFMRLKDNFRIWNYVRKVSDVKRVLSNFVPELRSQCTNLNQYIQMTSLFADSVYALYRAVQDNDYDGSFYNLMLDANEARDYAIYNYNNTAPANRQTASDTVNNPVSAAVQTQTNTAETLQNKLTLNDIEEVNTYLIDIAKKYANVISQTETKSAALTFNPPRTNTYNENMYLNESGNANDIFGKAVLKTRPCMDDMDSTLLKLINTKGFDPNYRYSDGYNVGCRPIFILTTLNKPYLLQEALKLRNADPNLINGGSLTALVRAVQTNTLDCAYVLLKSGKISPLEIERCKREYSTSPEMRGLLNSYPDMDEYITSTLKSIQALEKINIKTLDDVLRTPNIDVNFIDSNGNNILHAACALKDKDEAMRLVSNALGNNVNINCVNKKGEAPITVAIKNKNYDLAAFLINKGADLSVFKDELDNSFAHMIISNVDEEEAIKLLDIAKEKGINLDMQNCGGVTPFMHAVKLKKYKIIQYLLKNGVMTNKTDNFGRTGLHFACLLNDPKSLEILLNSFVNTRIKDNTGKLAGEYLKKQELINFYKMFDTMF